MAQDGAVEFSEIQETFELMDDWEDRYGYVIDLGKDMPEFPAEKRIPELKVDGCVSQVWLDIEIERDPNGAAMFTFRGDSDALIVRGLIAILRSLLSGKPAVEVAASDPLASFAGLGLDSQLSPQRSNGLRAMVDRIKAVAAAAS